MRRWMKYLLLDAPSAEHPQREIKAAYPDARDFDPQPLGDCWFFTTELQKPAAKPFYDAPGWS